MSSNEKLLAIAGPTASGKTGLAMDVADKYGGEIIAADSRTIYKGMDIGTAKPTPEEQRRIPHHLLGIREPNERYSAAQFKRAAKAVINEIQERERLPILTGGTGLYIWSVLYDYRFPAGPSGELRQRLEQKTLEELVEILKRRDPETAQQVDLRNPRRVIRAIETAGQPRRRLQDMPPGTLLVILSPPAPVLKQRIAARTRQMLERGLMEETRELYDHYGSAGALNSPGYAEMIDYIEGKATLKEAEEAINTHTYQLSRRQLSWLRRDNNAVWAEDVQQARRIIDGFLAG